MDLTTNQSKNDSIVCYCYRLTTSNLLEAYARCGSLQGVEKETHAGTGCGGCRVILQSLFGEQPQDINRLANEPQSGSSCARPGSRVMKGLVIADGQLESRVVSANAAAPQLGDCDMTASLEYLLLDQSGAPAIYRKQTVKTNETFVFDTRNEDLPRPFYGMFYLLFDRSNYGAARFNVYWSNGVSTTSTHENASTGRPRVSIPLILDGRFVAGGNTTYVALMNPHTRAHNFEIIMHDVDTGERYVWGGKLESHNTSWLNVSQSMLKPILEKNPNARLVFTMESGELRTHSAITVYFFIHNEKTNLWNVNHL